MEGSTVLTPERREEDRRADFGVEFDGGLLESVELKDSIGLT